MPEKFQIILRFSLIFSDFLLNYPNFSDFLRFSLIFSKFPDFSSYLCTRKSASRKEGGGVIIFMKVLKNDEALPSEIDSRAFFSLWTSDGIAGNGEQDGGLGSWACWGRVWARLLPLMTIPPWLLPCTAVESSGNPQTRRLFCAFLSRCRMMACSVPSVHC